MTNIINPLDAFIQEAAKVKTDTTITKVLTRHQQRQSANSTIESIVLADVSSSMNEMAGNESKIEILKKALSDAKIDWTTQKLIAFSSFPQPVGQPCDLPMPNGGTALHKAIEYIYDYKPKRTLVISDGQPDSEQLALSAADLLTGKIDILYVGPDNDHQALAFMYKLAARTGGTIMTNDIMKEKKQLTSKIKALLQ